MRLNVAVIQAVPRLTRGKVSTPGEPVPSREAYNRHERIADLVQYKHWRVGSRGSDRGLVEHKDLGELSEKQLLGATELATVFTLPVWDGERPHCLCDRIGHRLLLLRGGNAELGEGIGLGLLVRAIVTLDGVRYPEAHELIKEGNFVDEEVYELVGVADVLPGGHVRRHLHTFVEGLEPLISFTSPDFREAHFDRDSSVLLTLVETSLEVRDAEDRLEGCVDPTGSVLVAKSEHSLLLEG